MVITVPNDYKETVSLQSSLPNFYQNVIPFAEIRNSLDCFSISLSHEMGTQETSDSASSSVENVSKNPK